MGETPYLSNSELLVKTLGHERNEENPL